MKKLCIIIVITLVSLNIACDRNDLPNEVPECIEQKIQEFLQSGIICDTGANVTKYNFKGEQVYVFYEGACWTDAGSMVFDKNCNEKCYLGGKGGFRQCDSVDFYDYATNAKIVWKN